MVPKFDAEVSGQRMPHFLLGFCMYEVELSLLDTVLSSISCVIVIKFIKIEFVLILI